MRKHAAQIGGIAALTSLAIGAAMIAPAHSQDNANRADQCSAMAQASFGQDVQITSALYVDGHTTAVPDRNGWQDLADLPRHCLVEGVINQRQGAGGKTYGIGFAIALPDDWSGRFLLQGGGGLNGSVRQPVGPVATNGRPALSRGFAVIAHDSGHQGVVFDASFMQDQRAALDFAETSVKTVTQLGKEVTRRFYASEIGHSYMTGCSTGGREGMLASQRYPELFDGIIIGAPAMRAGDSNLAIEYTQVLLNQVAPRTGDGLPDITQLLSPDIRQTILNGMLAQCDGRDGLEDGMIENVAACRDFEPAELICQSGQSDNCISAPLAGALKTAFAGPFDAAGYPIYAPNAFDTGIVSQPSGYLPGGAPGPFGPPSTATDIDLDARLHALRWDAAGRLTDTTYWTGLNTYLDRGGKLMFFHGVSDFWFSPFATWDYYQRASHTNGAAFTDASRFYMVPGMLHCQGGNAYDQFDMLGKLVDWVEQDAAPQEIIAHKPAPASQSRPLCPYPGYAHFDGGDADKAQSYSCRQPDAQ